MSSSSFSVRFYLSDNFPADTFVEVQLQDGISWEILLVDVKTAIEQRGLCKDKNEIDIMSINTIDVSDGEIETVIDSVKKLKRNYSNCVPYKDELKMLVICYVVSTISPSQGSVG